MTAGAQGGPAGAGAQGGPAGERRRGQGRAVGELLTPGDVDAAVTAFLHASPSRRRWDVEHDFAWPDADAGRLTEGQRSAVQFITIVEDHLPGYFAGYQGYFPVDDSVDSATFLHNREVYHFTVRWAQEEDSHARALFRYQVCSGMTDADALRASLAVDGQRTFVLPYTHPVQVFAYPLVQEKATQLYYQHLRDVVDDPVLRELLNRLSRDEARHFSFFAAMVSRYLQVYGDAVVEPIRDVIATFRMPLADTMRGYWRWALKIADTARYDHTEAYEHLIKVMNRAVDAPSDRLAELVRFVAACRTIEVT